MWLAGTLEQCFLCAWRKCACAAGVAEAIHDSEGYGFTVPSVNFDFSVLKANRDAYVKRLNGACPTIPGGSCVALSFLAGIYERNLGKADIQMFEGKAKFVSDNEVEVHGVHR